jgi:hypothetical protein
VGDFATGQVDRSASSGRDDATGQCVSCAAGNRSYLSAAGWQSFDVRPLASEFRRPGSGKDAAGPGRAFSNDPNAVTAYNIYELQMLRE